jgi:hypothetical protein
MRSEKLYQKKKSKQTRPEPPLLPLSEIGIHNTTVPNTSQIMDRTFSAKSTATAKKKKPE